jgi:hypothetical protein
VQDEIAASDRTSIRQPDLPRDFFLCTSPAARRGLRYINLECAIGDYEGQLQRVRWLEDRLP